MKTTARLRGRNRWPIRLPILAHVVETLLAIVILAAGQNMWSVLVGASPDIMPPTSPTNLSMVGRSSSSIDISWTASTDDTGVTGYHVFRGGVQIGTTAATTYSDSNLTPNTSYTYTVTAFDAANNESGPSGSLVASTLIDNSPPSTPANLHQTGQTTTTVTIAWNPSSDNVAVTAYDIFRNGSLIKTQAGTSYTDIGLAVYSGYSYNIRARDGSGNVSGLSTTLIANTAQDMTGPSVPDGIHQTGSTVSTITLAWNASTDDVGVTGYRIYRGGTLVGTTGATTFTDTGLSVNSSYIYTLLAYDNAGNSSALSAPYNTSSSADVTAPSIPSGLHSTTVQDTSIGLAWSTSSDDVGVMGYKIYRGGVLIGTAPSTSYTATGLDPATNYNFTVSAYDAANNTSSQSSSVGVQTAFDTTAPTTPTNLGYSSVTDTTISLRWDVASDNVAVSGYDIYRDGALITSTVGATFTDTGLSVNTGYTYRVRSHDASNNNSTLSDPLLAATIPDMVAPGAPAGLVAGSRTTTSITLNWSPASDDVGVTGYKVYKGGTLLTTVTGTSYTNSGLTYNTNYSYKVTAIDAANNESTFSNTLNTSTLTDTTPPTVSLTTPAAGSSQQLTFGISATASDDLDLKRVEFYADSTLIATITAAPYSFNWNSYAVHNGSRVITAKAIDASGNYATSARTISIINPPPAIIGDLNNDHKVNLFDLSILLSHWNKPGTGDLNNNGKVDIFDLSVLLSHYGSDNTNYN